MNAETPQPQADFFVAINGNDAWSGTLAAPNPARTDGPFATLGRARDAIRQARARDTKPRSYGVAIRGGVYRLSEPLVFSPEDSGAAGARTVYEAWPGETPIISGGRAITGWRQGRGEIWMTEIPAVKSGNWYFNQLFVNGQRRQRARIPNEGYLRTDGPAVDYKRDKDLTKGIKEIRNAFKYANDDLRADWSNLEDVNVVLYHSWTNSWHWLDRIDAAVKVAQLATPSQWPVSWWEREQRYHVENVREGLDAPGEWYLDRKTGVLEYWPMPGEDMTRADVAAPVLTELVRFEGEWERGRLVHDIVLRGLSFQHAEWTVADKKQPVDGQAATFLTAALSARGAERCAIERCEIAHVGGYGVWFEAGCKDNRVFHCEIHDLGGGGVRIGEHQRQKTKSKDDAEKGVAVPEMAFAGTGPRDTAHNVIDNNFIHDGGRVFTGAVGVLIGHSPYNRVTHNEICDLRYSGVSVGWVWGFGQSPAHHNTIADNRIHHLGQGVMSDMGGVYSLGPSPGTRVEHNLIYKVLAYSYGGWGLYTDEGSSEIVLENNVVCDTKTGGFHQHYGAKNVIRNNVFAFSREGQIVRAREDKLNSVTFERNIVYCDNDQALAKVWKNGDYKVDNNLYWGANAVELLFGGSDFAEWQATGQDRHSLIADPLFVDAAGRDFRLKPGSPADKIGFQPIDISTIGLYGEPEWVGKPAQTPMPKFTLPQTAASGPTPIDDSFEDTASGARPAGATVSGESGAASIRVTAEAATGGRRSLKFTDAPGLDQSYQPHMYYKPNYRSGLARSSFDLRLGAGAIVSHEWRDAAKPYRVGPSLKIEANGDLLASKQKVMSLPRDKWIHIEIACGLGAQSSGAYDLVVTIEGQPPQRFEKLPLGSPMFKKLEWFGFTSLATETTVFYLDNLKLAVAAR